MSSCLSGGGGGGRTYRLDLDIVKSSAASASALASASGLSSAPARSSSSSASSSVLSDSSNSPLLAISIKKPRAPRKRPNQTYNEAAALLSTAYPTVFLPSKALSKQPKPLLLSHKFPDPSADLLPAFPVLSSDAAFLIRRPADQKPLQPVLAADQQPALSSPTSAVTAEFRDGGCNSPALSPAVSNEFREPPESPAFSNDDFDTESILDEEAAAEQGIDAIMGNLSMSASANSNENENEKGNANANANENSHSIRSCGINPYIKSPMVFGLGSKFELGLGFTYGRRIHRALRQRDGGYRWSSPTVPVKDICSKFQAPTAPSSAPPPPPEVKKSKKKSKKVERKVLVDSDSPAAAPPAAAADAEQAEVGSKRVALGLKLNHDEVLKAWSDRGSMFSSDGPDSPNSSAEALAKLADIDLVPENGAASVLREASVMRYKEKRRSRLFAKKIRYQVRKVNADCRPRMKASGRFVRRPSLLQQAMEEES